MSSIQNHSSSRNDEKDFEYASQLATGSILYMAMQVAIELNVFKVIAKAGVGAQLSPKTIASQLPTKNPKAYSMLDRLLRLLTSYSILNSTAITDSDGIVERLYGLGRVSKYFVQNEDGVSMSPLFHLTQDKVFMDSRSYMKEAILEGGVPFDKAHGMDAFEYQGVDPRFNQVFNTAMFNHTTIIMNKMLQIYGGFESLTDVVDVGGGIGTTIGIITQKYPRVRGTNFDLPHVIVNAMPYPRVEHVGGNMFESVPTGEAIFMKWILHDWTDEHCLSILKNCYKALPDHGKLIVVEVIVPVEVENDTAAKSLYQYDVIMLTQNPGGKERTEEEFKLLGEKAGFACMKKVCCVYNFWVLEFYKA